MTSVHNETIQRKCIDSLRPGDAYMPHWTATVLHQIMLVDCRRLLALGLIYRTDMVIHNIYFRNKIAFRFYAGVMSLNGGTAYTMNHFIFISHMSYHAISGYISNHYIMFIMAPNIFDVACSLQPRLVYIYDLYIEIIYVIHCLTHTVCVDIVCHMWYPGCMEYSITSLHVRGIPCLPSCVTVCGPFY